MRKVFLDGLPRWGEDSKYKGKINWKESVSNRVPFVYDEIQGEFEILDYKIPNLLLRYESNLHTIATSSLIGSRLGLILGIVRTEYYYSVGEIVKTNKGEIEILDQIRVRGKRGYKYKCLKDNNIDRLSEYDLKNGLGCNVCSNKKVKKGVNDILSTHPRLKSYFVNIKDTYDISYGSEKEITLKCPECGFLKDRRVVDLVNNGFACPICSDNISYPEKFMVNFLNQLNIAYDQQFSSKWSKGKRYDFYIKPNIIIETHGEQHYFNSFKHIGGKSLKDEQENDILKEQLAKENGIENYIVIDCRKSELEWIKKGILNSKLNYIYDLSSVNWFTCHEFACKSLVKEVSDLWNKGHNSPNKIAKEINLHNSTVRRYLKKGRELGWNDYDEAKTLEPIYKSRRKKIICLNTMEIHSYAKEIEEKYKVASSFVNAVCNGKNKYIKINNEPFVFMFYEDYIGNEVKAESILTDIYRIFDGKRQKQVVCLNTGQVFTTLKEASDEFNIAYPNIINCCKGLQSYAGVHFETKEKLVWMYFKDYEKLSREEIEEILLKTGDRQIVQFTKDLEYITEFSSINEASELLKINKEYISENLRGKRKTTNGFIFVYKDKYINNEITPENHKFSTKGKCVLKLDQTVNILEEFESVTSAMNITGIKHISSVCRGERKTAGGFYWMYKEDYDRYMEEHL